MSNICIIPARGGSKRIPRKNIKNFNGRPVIYYAISNALNSGLFDEVMVSTDDDEIARISIELGAKVPFFRSKETADDDASTADVIIEVLKKYKDLNIYFDNVCCIYPVTPLLPCSKLNTSFDKFISNNYNSLITIKKYSHPIQRAFSLKENKIEINDEEYFASKTQDLESNYFDAGQFYWLNIDYFFKNKKMISDNTGYIELHEFESEDIDNDRDWRTCIIALSAKHLHWLQ